MGEGEGSGAPFVGVECAPGLLEGDERPRRVVEVEAAAARLSVYLALVDPVEPVRVVLATGLPTGPPPGSAVPTSCRTREHEEQPRILRPRPGGYRNGSDRVSAPRSIGAPLRSGTRRADQKAEGRRLGLHGTDWVQQRASGNALRGGGRGQSDKPPSTAVGPCHDAPSGNRRERPGQTHQKWASKLRQRASTARRAANTARKSAAKSAFPQVRTILPGDAGWGGWDSNPRPTDYESAALTG